MTTTMTRYNDDDCDNNDEMTMTIMTAMMLMSDCSCRRMMNSRCWWFYTCRHSRRVQETVHSDQRRQGIVCRRAATVWQEVQLSPSMTDTKCCQRWAPTNRCQQSTWHTTKVWRFGAVGSDVGQINKVTLRRARLVLGWVTISGFNSWCGKIISV